ncbi:hypothetical protein, partial [Mesorhizobium sp. M2E.F.Ca.ET.209.01.1.1]|uniref:hypothetical protein n=1 Tax=Mesorhizobium sp. M2E.F.Ca.ET.209.01.1.1 TaxID=2500526 RepID=UPI001FF071C8
DVFSLISGGECYRNSIVPRREVGHLKGKPADDRLTRSHNDVIVAIRQKCIVGKDNLTMPIANSESQDRALKVQMCLCLDLKDYILPTR